jgi:acyl carrier protein
LLDLIDQLTSLVAAQLGLSSVRSSDLIVEDLGAESMDIVNIIASVEDRFGIRIDEQALPDIHSVADLHDLVARAIAG